VTSDEVKNSSTDQTMSEGEDLKSKVKELQERLAESESTLSAIRSGEVDAIVVSTAEGERIFTLKGAEEPYRVLFEQMSEGAVTISDDGGILYINKSFAKLMKTSLERLIGTSIFSYLRPPDLRKFREMLESSTRGPVRDEMKLMARDGTSVPMQLSISFLPEVGVPTYCIVVANLTERILAEEMLRKAHDELELKVQERTKALSKSERSLAEAQRIARIGSWEWNIQTGEVNWSVEMYSIYGLDLNSFVPTIDSFADYVHPDDREFVNNEIRKVVSKGAPVNFDFRIIAADGFNHVLNTTGEIAELDENGKPRLMIGTNQDITERKLAQRVVEEYSKKLERSNAELQQFAYVASHDLQEPLRMVMSYLALLNKKYGNELNPQAKEYMSTATEGAERMRQLVNDLLQYSRIDSRGGEFVPVDMNKVAEAVTNDLHVAIDEAKAEVIVEPLPTVLADETQMKQLLTNLVSNAIKFHDNEPPEIEVRARMRANEFVFAVKDNGIGIDPQYHDNLFKMFQRLHTKDEYPGTGIGLAISKKIVERHGGRIWVESEAGKGSTFYFAIPRGGSDQ
jgi:PAS domain S-box-containing protein